MGWEKGVQIPEEGAFQVGRLSSTKEQRQNQECYIPEIKMIPTDWHEESQSSRKRSQGSDMKGLLLLMSLESHWKVLSRNET